LKNCRGINLGSFWLFSHFGLSLKEKE